MINWTVISLLCDDVMVVFVLLNKIAYYYVSITNSKKVSSRDFLTPTESCLMHESRAQIGFFSCVVD